MLLVMQALVSNILFIQRSSCIGKSQVEKRVRLFVQAYNVTCFVVRGVNRYITIFQSISYNNACMEKDKTDQEKTDN